MLVANMKPSECGIMSTVSKRDTGLCYETNRVSPLLLDK